ncbi:MAG: transglutaminase domain-containing protein [bacterium]
MKTSICVFIVSVLAVIGCSAQENQTNSIHAGQIRNEADLLDFYRQYSEFTDPGEYTYLYENLPDSLEGLCRIIKSQYINPYVLAMDGGQIPKEKVNDMMKYPTVKLALEGLLSYDSSGLVPDRKPEDRLFLICRDNAILLASILKYRGIPARVRYGFAPYLMPDFHASHVICEVWNEMDKRWMLVDPSTNMIDFSRDQFDFSNDVWLQLQNKEIDPDKYGVPGRYSGFISIVGKVCPDLASILGTEYAVHHYAPILDYAFENNDQLTDEHIETLNSISELMKSIDAENLSKLQNIYSSTPQIQITKQFTYQ